MHNVSLYQTLIPGCLFSGIISNHKYVNFFKISVNISFVKGSYEFTLEIIKPPSPLMGEVKERVIKSWMVI